MSLRIRYWRKKRALTQEELAERAGFAVSQVSRWERWTMGEKRPPDAAQLTKIAEALGVRPGDLMPSGRAVPVVGYVGAGQQVFGIDDHPRGRGIYYVRSPEGMDPDATVALEVKGASMAPVTDGWLVFYSRPHDFAPADIVGRVCVVKVANDGPYLLKRVRPGYEPGRYNLISTNAEPIENVELEWAAPIGPWLPPEAVVRVEPDERDD